MLYNEMRPYTFDGMVGQKEIVANIRKQSIRDIFFQVYVLGGHFGCGKTTMARIIAMAANCEHKDENGNPCGKCSSCQAVLSETEMDVVELDAASNTGVDAIRDLKETVMYRPAQLKKKVYIIDEVHMLSTGAFNALLKVLEEPPEHVMFCLCTTEVKKIPATVRSRAACYQFGQIMGHDMIPYLQSVAEQKGYTVTDDALSLIAKNSQGAMRNALSLIEQASEMGEITEDVVSSMLGISDPAYLFQLLKHLVSADTANAIMDVDVLFEGGKEPFLMVSDLLDICADCVMAFYTGSENINGTESYCKMVQSVTESASSELICSITDGLMMVRDELRTMPEKTTLVCGIIRMLSDKSGAITMLTAKIRALTEKVEKLESGQTVLQTVTTTDIAVETQVDNQKKEDNVSEEDIFNSSVPENYFDDAVSTDTIQSGTEDKDNIPAETVLTQETHSDDVVEKTEEKEEDIFGSFGLFGDVYDMFDSSDTEEMSRKREEKENDIAVAEELFGSCETISTSDFENVSVKPEEAVEEFLEDLRTRNPNIYSLINNILTVACTKTIEDGKVVYTTTQAPVYKLLQTNEGVVTKSGFPFIYRLNE